MLKTFMDEVKVYEILDNTLTVLKFFYHAVCAHYKTFSIMNFVLNEA